MGKSRLTKRRLTKGQKKERRRQAMEMLITVWFYVRIVIDSIIDFLFGWYYNGKEVKIPASSKPLILESAVSIARSIRNKKRTCEEVVAAFIDQIEKINPIVNAVTDNRFEAALSEARKIDCDIAENRITAEDFNKKPFLGVPFSTKESTACASMFHSFGIVSRKNIRATEDADVVKLMKNAGAILIANTNVPEINLWQEARNNVYGTTFNPYNTTRTPGGSSGGEAALVASCGTGFGIGTDIGGSIRMPAFFCGVFGHKPTSYLISTKGLTTRTGLEKHTMVVPGPITRHAEDLTPILKVLVGPANINKLRLDTPVDLRSLKYFYVEDCKDVRVSPISGEMKDLMQRVVNHVSLINESDDEENNVTCLEIAELQYSSKLWRYWMTQEPSQFGDMIRNGNRVSVWEEIYKMITGNSDLTLAAIIKLADEQILPKENEKWALQVTAELRKKLMVELEKNGVLLYPSYTWPASYHYTAYLRPYNFSYWSIFNVLHFPVTQVPLGLSKDGLPVGIQVVAAPYNDHLCIAVAKHLEDIFGGYVPPFNLQ